MNCKMAGLVDEFVVSSILAFGPRLMELCMWNVNTLWLAGRIYGSLLLVL